MDPSGAAFSITAAHQAPILRPFIRLCARSKRPRLSVFGNLFDFSRLSGNPPGYNRFKFCRWPSRAVCADSCFTCQKQKSFDLILQMHADQ